MTQAVVTLVQDGFIALGGAGDEPLLLTREGEEAVTSGTLTRRVVSPARRTVVVMERLTGGLAPNAEIRFLDDRQVREQYRGAAKLPIRVGYNELDGAQVRHLLPRRQYEWVQYIGSIVQLSKGTQWLPVDADLEAGAVIGMPDRWDRRLATVILDEARRCAPEPGSVPTSFPPLPRQRQRLEPESGDPEAPRLPAESWFIDFEASQVLVDSANAAKRLHAALSEAETSLLLATPAIAVASVEAIAQDVTAACERDVRVEILWGEDRDRGLERLKKLHYDAKLSGRLDFNRQPAPTAMSAVVWDYGDVMSAIVGSGSLSEPGHESADTLAIELRDPGLAAMLFLAASGAWRAADGERLSSGPDRLARIAGELAAPMAHDIATGGIQVRVVLDRDHDVLLADGLRQSSRRLALISRRPSSVAASRLVELLTRPRDSNFEVHLVTGARADDPAIEHQVDGVLRAVGGTLTRRPGVGCGFVVDDRVTIGSYDPLASDTYETTRGLRHVSVELQGPEAADAVLSALLS